MADVNANIDINIDTSEALAQLKALQRQISQFHSSIAKGSEAAALAQRNLQRNFLNSVNALGAFSAELRTVRTTSESFTESLEKNKFSMREYFRYAGGATRTFGRLFKSEFDTIGKVAEDRVKKLQTQYIKLGRDTSGAMKAIAIIPNELDLKKYSTQTQLVAQRQAIFNQLVKQGSTNLLNFGKNTQWAGRQLMVGFTLPLASLGVTAARAFMDMETAALKFRKVYGDLFTPASETEAALDSINELGQQFTRYGIAVSQTVALAAEAAAAGFSGLDLQRQTTQATRLSVLGQIEQQKALETTISLQNAFRMSSANLGESIDFLNAVENQTVVSLDDITTAIPKVAPVIQQLGGDVKDLAFFMAAMKEGGINASEGANALKSGLAALINPTDKASKFLANMGINIKSIIEANKGDLKATVIAFAQALDTLDPLNRARAIEQLFGKFQFARLSTLFDNVINQTGQASRVLDLAGASVEELAALSDKELGMTADSAMNQFRKSVEDLKLALVPVGQTFLQAVTPIVEFIGGILEKFNNLSDGVKKAIVVLTVTIGAIGPLALMTFGLLANGLANIVKGALILRQGYLRLTGQTQILGEQTDYLTTEQLNATAVAHSLDQSHARLTQTFNAESTAINQLIQAYQSAARAGAQFAMNNPAMMLSPRPRGYAKGGEVFSVPGSGNQDTVPAMLTPGEIVIPKKQSQKYAGLIQGIIAENIPGYKKSNFGETIGTVLGGKFMQRRFSPVAMMAPGNTPGGFGMDPEWLAMSEEAKASFASAIKTAAMAEAGIKQTANNYNNFWQGLNPVLDEIFNVFKSGISDDIKTVAQLGEKQYPQIVAHIDSLVQNSKISAEQAEQLSVALRKLVMPLSSDKTQTNIKRVELALNEAGQTVIKRASYERFGETLKKQTISNFPRELAQRGMTVPQNIGDYSFAHIPQGSAQLTYVDPFLRKKAGAGSPAEQKVLADLRKGITFKEGQVIADAAVQGAIEGAATKSPSKKTIAVGEDIARGLQVGMQNQTDDVARTARALTQTAVGGMRDTGLLGPGGQPLRVPVGPAAGGINLGAAQENIAITKDTTQAAARQKDAINQNNAALGRLNGKLLGTTFAFGSIAGALSMFGADLGGLSPLLFKVNAGLFALATTLQILTNTKFLTLLIGGFGKFSKLLQKTKIGQAMGGTGIARGVGRAGAGIATRAGITAGVGGAAGITAATGGTALIVLAALAAIAASIYAVNKAYKKHMFEIERFGKAATISANELEGLKNALGANLAKSAFEAPTFFGKTPETQERGAKYEQAIKDSNELLTRVETLRKATADQATAILASFGIELIAREMSPQEVQTLLETMAKMSGKSKVLINSQIRLDTVNLEEQLKQSTDIFDLSFKPALAEANKSTKDLQKNLMLVAGVTSSAFNAVSSQLNRGTLSIEQANKSFTAIRNHIKTLGKTRELIVLKQSLVNLNPEFANIQRYVKGSADAFMLMKVGAAGVDLSGFISQIREAKGVTDELRNSLDTVFKGALGVLQLQRQVDEAKAKLDEMRANAIKTTSASSALTAEESLQKKIDAFKKMQAQLKIAAIIEVAKPAQADFKNNVNNIIANINKELAKVSVDLKINPESVKSIFDIEKELKRIDMDTAAAVTPEYRAAQFQIEDLNGSIEKYNRENDVANRKLSQLEEQYQKQADALQEVADMQNYLANQQKRQITIADALSQGDISAAASAAQEMRADAAQFRLDQEKKSLENNPQMLAIKKQIKANDEEIYNINEKIYAIQQASITPVEDALKKLEREKILLNDMKGDYDALVAYQVESLRIKGMSNQELDQEIELLQAQLELLQTNAKDAAETTGQYTKAQIDAQTKLLAELEAALTAAKVAQAAEIPEDAGPMGWWKRQWERFKIFLLEDIPAFFANLPNLIETAAGNIWSGVKTFGTWLKEGWDSIVEWVKDSPKRLKENMGNIWSGVITFGTWLKEGWDSIVEWVKDSPKRLKENMGNIWSGVITFGTWLKEGWDSIVEWVKDSPKRLEENIGNIWSGVKTFGAWLLEKWQEARPWLANLPTLLNETVGNIWLKTKTFGAWLLEKWQEARPWLANLPYLLGETVGNIWLRIKTFGTWLLEKWEEAKPWLANLPTLLNETTGNIWLKTKTFGAWLLEKWEGASTELSNFPRKIKDAVGDLWGKMPTIETYLLNVWKDFKEWLQSLPDKIGRVIASLNIFGSIWSQFTAGFGSFLGGSGSGSGGGGKSDTPTKPTKPTPPTKPTKPTPPTKPTKPTTPTKPTPTPTPTPPTKPTPTPTPTPPTKQKDTYTTQKVTTPEDTTPEDTTPNFDFEGRDKVIFTPEYTTPKDTTPEDTTPNFDFEGRDKVIFTPEYTTPETPFTVSGVRVVDGRTVIAATTQSIIAALPSLVGDQLSSQSIIAGGGGGRDSVTLLELAKGGYIKPKYMAKGGFTKGTDKIPAMLSPGEFIMSKYAVQNYGIDKLKAMNNGESSTDNVYNYSINVNVKSGANPDEIARSVMAQIKQIDSQRVRTQRAI
jgi:TP901 family phage tail tape measure protein